jgi:hypothetical protein
MAMYGTISVSISYLNRGLYLFVKKARVSNNPILMFALL